MNAPEAAGERFLATGDFIWMRQMAQILRDDLGAVGAKVSTRQLPDILVRTVALFDSGMRAVTPSLGRKNQHTTAKAQWLLSWHARPAQETVLAAARGLQH
ncbi:hypothetical protein [Renibacterium salmoninarum]|nr:hypothetical protein [Renibacterium salmoninarum]